MNKKISVLFLIFILGAFFRFLNLNWDSGFHLHPDERFLTMVGNAVKIPQSFWEYLNPNASPLNPSNNNFNFFVYGMFPITLNKIIAVFLKNDTYDLFTLQGRFLSAFLDSLIILLTYKTVELLEKKYNLDATIKYTASFFYAIAILPIQLSHFFATDTFLNFFIFASFYFSLKYSIESKIHLLIISALLIGIGISSKITALAIIPLLLCNVATGIFKKDVVKKRIYILLPFFFILYAVVIYISTRITDPYMFQTNNFLNFKINNSFQSSLELLSNYSKSNEWYPPNVQWIHKAPVLFSLKNIAIFGLGPMYFFFFLAGIFTIVAKRQPILLVILAWTLLFFLYQSSQFAKTMRYFIFLYPFFAIIAAFGFYQICKRSKLFISLSVFILLMYPLLFISIYLQKNTRVQATDWIYQFIPNNSTLLVEHWDDPLPLLLPNAHEKLYILETLPVFDKDSQEKIKTITLALANADYLILSSNRGWGSIQTVPKRYPYMAKFYGDLFNNKLAYRKVKEFTSYPSIRYLGIPLDFPDDFAEESFTVYDHPKVIVFKKM